MQFEIVLILVFVIGVLSQSIGLCMVRGVNEFKSGKPEFLVAILLSGVLAWVAIIFSSYVGTPTNFKSHELDIWFAVGGGLFGLGAAFNQGCGVSTLSKLSRGDVNMLFTIAGWLIGWLALSFWNPAITYNEFSNSHELFFLILVGLTIILLIWALAGGKNRRTLWLTMMSIGLIGGFVFLYDPKWPPSGLLHKVSHAIVNPDQTLWPPIESYLLFLSLLMGMFVAAWHTQRFLLVLSSWRELLVHLSAGCLMGVGASLALGGNDTQLLLALPTFSPAGGVAIVGMLIGIWAGLFVRKKLFTKSS